MNGLLKSKVFKKNLRKWLTMYIGILGLFATVVTYSKYISRFDGNRQAKAAKFAVDIKFDNEECTGNDCSIRDLGELRPTSDYEFSFVVDTSQLEVTTILATTITVNENLTDVKIFEGENEITSDSSKDKYYVNTGNAYTIVDKVEKDSNGVVINASGGSATTYKVTAKVDKEKVKNNDIEYGKELKDIPAIQVAYSAIQKN